MASALKIMTMAVIKEGIMELREFGGLTGPYVRQHMAAPAK